MPNFNVNGNGNNQKKGSIPKKVVGYVKTNKNHTSPNTEIVIRTDCCFGHLMNLNPLIGDKTNNIFTAIPQWQKNNIEFVIHDKDIITRLEKSGIILEKNQIAPHLLEEQKIRGDKSPIISKAI